MQYSNTTVWKFFGLWVVVALSGCVAPPTKVADITSDKMGYMDKHFSAQRIKAGVAKAVSGKMPSVDIEKYQDLEISFIVETTNADGQKSTKDVVIISRSAGDGFAQQLNEFSSNGIPINLFYVTRYGVANLRQQFVPLQAPFALPVIEVKKIDRFDPVEMREGGEFVIDLSTGDERIDESSPIKYVCKTNKIGLAKEVNFLLKGRAVNIGCTIVNGKSGAVSGRIEWLFLEKYAAPFVLESVSSNSKTVYKIQDVKVRN